MRGWIDELEERTRAFAVRIVRLAEGLDATKLPRTIIWQLVDAATSVAANHRACRRARSTRELVSKLAVVEEEADETALWLEIIRELRNQPNIQRDTVELHSEAVALRGLFAKARATTRERLAR